MMNNKSSLKIIFRLFVFLTLLLLNSGCSDQNAGSTSTGNNGVIEGKISEKVQEIIDEKASRKTSQDVDPLIEVFLYNQAAPESALDTLTLNDKTEPFVFNHLSYGEYAIRVDVDGEKGGFVDNIKVENSDIVYVTIEISIYIIQNFYVGISESELDSILSAFELAHSKLSGDTLYILLPEDAVDDSVVVVVNDSTFVSQPKSSSVTPSSSQISSSSKNSSSEIISSSSESSSSEIVSSSSKSSSSKSSSSEIVSSSSKSSSSEIVSSSSSVQLFDTLEVILDETNAADAQIEMGNNKNANYSSYQYFEIGTYDPSTLLRGLLKFNLPTISLGSVFSSAHLQMTTCRWFYKLGGSREITIDAHQMLSTWKEGDPSNTYGTNTSGIDGVTATERFWGTPWQSFGIGTNDTDASALSYGSGNVIPPNIVANTTSIQTPIDIDITQLVDRWYSGYENFGLLLKYRNESIPNSEIPHLPSWCSTETNNSNLKPRVIFIFKKQ